MAEYIRCFSMAETIHSTCEDYRAAATIGLQHDEADMDQRIQCPLQVLCGGARLMEKTYDVLETWREHAVDVSGGALDCGHFLAEGKTLGNLRRAGGVFPAVTSGSGCFPKVFSRWCRHGKKR